MTAPTSPGSDLEALRTLLARRAFLDARDGHDLRTRTGGRMPWIFYGPVVSLSQPGLGLIASVLLDRLAAFESRQIASYGLSALPIVGACIERGAGRYRGLTVRPEKKGYGSGRRIDGDVDTSGSVVVIDESLCSGTSAYRAISALEAEGLRVEGALCLVDFSGYGAAQWLAARGYRLETVFDVWSELGRTVDAASGQVPGAPDEWSAVAVPDGLSAAAAARFVVEEFRRSGAPPRPPDRLDQDYDSRGGTYVSVRRRADGVRLTRAGFRRDDDMRSAPLDVVLAAHRAALTGSVAAVEDLSTVAFAVSFLGDARPARLGEIDHRRDALLLRGVAPLERIGLALPNAPHYDDEIQQYRYARSVTANFWRTEPDSVHRQGVIRSVEADAWWPPDGAPAGGVARPGIETFAGDGSRDGAVTIDAFADALAARIGAVLRAELAAAPESPDPPDPPDPADPADPAEVTGPAHATGPADDSGRAQALLPAPPQPVDAVGISIYTDRLVGCALSFAADLDRALAEATRSALHDRRYASIRGPLDPDRLRVVVSLLHRRRWLGRLATDRVPLYTRLGRDTLAATSTGPGRRRTGLVLAHFAVHQSLSGTDYARQVLTKAAITDAPADWSAYETTAWLVEAGRSVELDHGLPRRALRRTGERVDVVTLATQVARFVAGQRGDDGLPAYHVHGWTGRRDQRGTATRVLLAAVGLLEAGAAVGHNATAIGAEIVERFVGGETPGRALSWDSGTDAVLLAALSLLPGRARHVQLAQRLVARLTPLIRADGAVYRDGPQRMTADLDLLSGVAVLALARAAAWVPDALAGVDLERSLAFYSRRFDLDHPWAMVWWHAQAWIAAADFVPGAQDFAFSLIDWAADRQSPSGAFVIHDIEPYRFSFLTACVLEGVADAWRRADRIGDAPRAARYARLWWRGFTFVDRLVIGDRDVFWHPERGPRGGVRATLVSTDLRIDYAGHTLIALGKGLQAMAATSTYDDDEDIDVTSTAGRPLSAAGLSAMPATTPPGDR